MYYKDVVWGDSKLEMAVHEPAPEEGARERVSYWGWPQEHQSWLLLAGLLDTDGCVGSKKKISKVSTYSSKSEHLRDGISYVVRSLGGLSTKNESTRFKYGRDVYKRQS